MLPVVGVSVRFIRAGRALAVAGLLAAVGVAIGACGCPPDADHIYLLHDPDGSTPELQPLLDQCRQPAAPDCLPLCQTLSGARLEYILHCELHQERDGYLQVHVGIHEFCPGAG